MIFDKAFEDVGRNAVLGDIRRDEPMAGMDHVRMSAEEAIGVGRIRTLKEAGILAVKGALIAGALWTVGEMADQNRALHQTPPAVEAPAPTTAP